MFREKFKFKELAKYLSFKSNGGFIIGLIGPLRLAFLSITNNIVAVM